jgi:hypothetical protein
LLVEKKDMPNTILNKNILIKKRLIDYIFSILFFFILCFPQSLYAIKILLMCILIVFLLLDVKKPKLSISNEILGIILIILLFNLFYILLGQFRGYPAVKYYFLTHIAWILFYGLLCFRIDTDSFFTILRTILFSSIFIYIIGIISAILFNFQGITKFAMFEETIRSGYPLVAIGGGVIVNIIFSSPIILIMTILNGGKKYCIPLMILFVIFTSRRAIMLNLALAPFICFFLLSFVREKSDRRKYNNLYLKILFILLLVIVTMLIVDISSSKINFIEYIVFVKNAFEFSRIIDNNINAGGYLRALQFRSLIDGWKEHPFFGHGIAANASVIRSDTIPGAYELTYIALLFQRGLFGFIIYFLQLGYIIFNLFYYSLKYQRIRNFLISILTGFICFLIANGTNPYLEAFDHLWILFFPLFAINLIKKDPIEFIRKYEYYKRKL